MKNVFAIIPNYCIFADGSEGVLKNVARELCIGKHLTNYKFITITSYHRIIIRFQVIIK